ncbi:peptidase S53 [Sulfolobus sp. S-194]|uniref:protease pro-enzyme activation domain-containing protein n=1 Tax=Sulfolobus sp. S-194 TaxID=2512240 RepID=UPI0014373419|nr:protease pro-enzyme activation domain-containing protein [Sulfolobus sp. S-194]QIW25144.1 peptidase S53 [Sulfolobus sp. S-194]
MKSVLSIPVVVIILFSIITIISPINGFSATYMGPQLKGVKIGSLPKNMEITIGFLIPPKNFNLLYLTAEEVANHQIKPISFKQVMKEFAQPELKNEVVNYLVSHGFTISVQTPFVVIAEAPVSVIEETFHTTLDLYKYGNVVYYRPSTNPTLPSFFAGITINGLTNFTTYNYQLNLEVLGKVVNGKLIPNMTFPQVTTFQFAADMYSPQDIIGAYNITQGGNGTTVAIIDAYGDPTIYEDLQIFDQHFHLPSVNLTIIPLGPYHPLFGLFTGWDIETALDVETVHAIAPYAHIVLVVPSSAGLIPEAIDYIVSEDLANVTSMSFGIIENLIGDTGFYFVFDGVLMPNLPYWDYYFALGTVEGISFFAASGDEGAYGGTLTTYGGVSYPSTSPFVTSVGGTSLYVNVTSGYLSAQNSSATYGFETGWSIFNLDFPFIGSDGGYSTYYPKPWYQYMINGTTRATPDVAADANPYTGLLIYVLGQEEVIGGTSLATPIWAGIDADIVSIVHKPLGLFNNILYWIYSNSTLYNQAFHQVTFGFNGLYSAHSGYNLVTGLGTPDFYGLLKAVEDYFKQPKLGISVTALESGVPYPWFMYNTTFEIIAKISYPNTTMVTSGSFSAYIYTTQGLLSKVPLAFNGTYWVGTYTISPGNPPNIWLIVVNGTSNGISGTGVYEITVGLSIDIISPIPFPFEITIPPNEPFEVAACIYYPNLTPVEYPSFTAYFIHNSKNIFNVTLLPTRIPGLYEGIYALVTPEPEGVYLMYINNSYSSTYMYETFGGINIETLVFTPIDDGFSSVSPGENITIFSFTFDQNGLAIFTSNATAFIYNPQGKLIAKIPLKLALDIVQFGNIIAFGFHEANYTIPLNSTPGIYTIITEAWYNSSIGVEEFNYTDFIYVSPYVIHTQVKYEGNAIEGENIAVYANITYPNGTEVKYGEFQATLVPSELQFEQLTLEFYTEIPLQYNSTLNEWIGVLSVPSINSTNIYQGAPLYFLSGPWYLEVSGISPEGAITESINNLLSVLPYTDIGSKIITPINATSVGFAYQGNTIELTQIYSPSLTLMNGKYILNNVIVNELIIKNSTVTIIDSKLNNVETYSSNVNIVDSEISDTETGISSMSSNITLTSVTFSNVIYAINQSVNTNVYLHGVNLNNVTTLSSVPAPNIVSYPANITTLTNNITLSISGKYLKVINVKVNGKNVSYSVTPTTSGIDITIPFNSALLPAGNNIISIAISDGIEYNYTLVVYNSYPLIQVHSAINALNSSVTSLKSSLSTTTDISIIGLVIALIAVILLLLLFRRGGRR